MRIKTYINNQFNNKTYVIKILLVKENFCLHYGRNNFEAFAVLGFLRDVGS